MRIFATAIAIAAICISGLRASATDWNECVLAAVDSFPERGGYYTGAARTPISQKRQYKRSTRHSRWTVLTTGRRSRPPSPNRRSAPAPPMPC